MFLSDRCTGLQGEDMYRRRNNKLYFVWDTTSKDTITSSSLRACWEMSSAKSLELRTRRWTSGLCTFGRLYNCGVLPAELLRCEYTPPGSQPDRFRVNTMLFKFLSKGGIRSFFTERYVFSSPSIVSILTSLSALFITTVTLVAKSLSIR